ncbi:MAG: hypothetical protein DSM106950_15010 [Stigonema ocellatum SAG 48.90 = DSM 106950]|nr:hypothetical protein [Stigonema ocellatum SAG 48.90 = DSM 106950]
MGSGEWGVGSREWGVGFVFHNQQPTTNHQPPTIPTPLSGNQPPAAKEAIINTESKIPGVNNVTSIKKSWVFMNFICFIIALIAMLDQPAATCD